jgi:hypothetical protein
MKSLYVVEVVRNSTHLDHSVSIISGEALDLRTPVQEQQQHISLFGLSPIDSPRVAAYLFWNQT